MLDDDTREQKTVDSKTFRAFRDLIYEESGINIGEKKEALILNRVGKRMRALEIADFREYYEFVKVDETGTELINLLDAVSTNVTSFYREPQHFAFIANAVRGWIAQGRRRFRAWCAACSTGEEPYSLAMTLLEAGKGHDCDIKILATDICTQVLRRGIEGVYAKDKVIDIPAKLRGTYFASRRRDNRREYAARPALTGVVRFARLNLSRPPFPMSGPFDLILIRNVMIYFDNHVRSRLLDQAHRLLRPGGYLVVGHAESLAGLLNNGFKRVETSIYVK